MTRLRSRQTCIPAILALVIVALASSLPVQAAPPSQQGAPLQYGETLSGTITEDVPCVYFWFEGTSGDPVTIDMTRTSGTLDGILELYQQDGDGFTQAPLIANDDQPGGGLDPLIAFALPATDWYTIAACRLQAGQMRPTTGSFDLTLTGPATAASAPDGQAEPTVAPGLSEGLFPTGPTATPAPAATAGDALSDILSGAGNSTALAPGKPITGELGAEMAAQYYTLDVGTGDTVVIDWQNVAATFAPLLRVTGEDGTIWAQATTPQAVNALTLAFYAPVDAALTLAVARHGDSLDGTGGSFVLQTSVAAAPVAGSTAAEPTPDTSTPAPGANLLENACRSGGEATYAEGASAQLANVYTAAGDGLTPEELTATGVFTTDDDLNVVFMPRIKALPVRVTGLFCAPGGTLLTEDEVTVRQNDTQYMMGVDWEYIGTPWVTGDWWVEIYINDVLELVLLFNVK